MSKQWLPPEEFAATLPKATVFGAVFFTDEDDRPVQLRATYSSVHPWQWPGGVADPGERPWQTAVRECREETGLTVPGPPRLLAAVFGLPGAEWRELMPGRDHARLEAVMAARRTGMPVCFDTWDWEA
ncbi:NUDIX domain-containing protein [Streptomyces sp. NPDC000410]|uniref:NUDIX domain-containing protein n=1 Tax=Streptomyces sp. NPDC000410 TaxID=3154254 RepID=UPI003333048E